MRVLELNVGHVFRTGIVARINQKVLVCLSAPLSPIRGLWEAIASGLQLPHSGRPSLD